MPKAYFDGKPLSSGGGADISINETLSKEDGVIGVAIPVNGVISQEDFDALPEEQKSHGLWVIHGNDTPSDTTGIYGVEWDGGPQTTLTRTDDAEFFEDPVPYVADGKTSGSSPFDGIYPWSAIEKVDDPEAGVMVKIPKFWYKLEQIGESGVKIQISDHEEAGYSVCPACMDRNDGAGTRDYILVGRYHCSGIDYKSTTNVKPKVSMQQKDFREAIHQLGSNVYMMDFATRFTLWLLYIVEFADWNSQLKIGKGCSLDSTNGTAVYEMGYTDSMPYHTGTTQTSRNSYGGTQYRWLEGLWDNCFDRLTGCYNSGNGLMVEVNPANFAESSGGTSVGTPANGWIAGLKLTTSVPFPCFINNSTDGGDETTYVCDHWGFDSPYPVVIAGGYYSQSGASGMFRGFYTTLVQNGANYGSRPIKLPS